MTSKTLTHLIIAAAVAGSAAAGLQVTASLASAASDLPPKAGSTPSGGALFFLLAPEANRFAAHAAGLTLVPIRIVRIAP